MFQHIFKQKCKCYVHIPLNINKIRHHLHMNGESQKKLGVPELNMKERTIQKSVSDYSSSFLGLAVTLKTCSDTVFGHTTLQLSRKKRVCYSKSIAILKTAELLSRLVRNMFKLVASLLLVSCQHSVGDIFFPSSIRFSLLIWDLKLRNCESRVGTLSSACPANSGIIHCKIRT